MFPYDCGVAGPLNRCSVLMNCKKPHLSRLQSHRRTYLRSLVLLALLSSCTLGELAEAQQKQACDVSQFQGNHSSIGSSYPTSCATCVFPSWQAVFLDTAAILQLDLTGKWLYMLGDSTTMQLHEALLGYLDEPQVVPASRVLVTIAAQRSLRTASSACHACYTECHEHVEASLVGAELPHMSKSRLQAHLQDSVRLRGN